MFLRKLLLKRIEEFSVKSENFNKMSGRWRNITFDAQHLSKIDFLALSDESLLDVYELILRQAFKQG